MNIDEDRLLQPLAIPKRPLPTPEEVEEIRKEMLDWYKKYQWVNCRDYSIILGFINNNYDRQHGWDDEMIRTATITHNRSGYWLDLPTPIKF
jgi:hypothetical protein